MATVKIYKNKDFSAKVIVKEPNSVDPMTWGTAPSGTWDLVSHGIGGSVELSGTLTFNAGGVANISISGASTTDLTSRMIGGCDVTLDIPTYFFALDINPDRTDIPMINVEVPVSVINT